MPNTLFPTDDAPFVILFRPSTGGRWKRIGTANCYAEALALIDKAGDWWIHSEVPAECSAGRQARESRAEPAVVRT